MMHREWTTREVVAREATRTLWRFTTWRAGVKSETREEWLAASADDGDAGGRGA
jgi:hypothetical protein